MSGNMKEKVAVCVNDGKTTPAATVPTANAYANATVLEQIKKLAAAFRHRKSTKTSSQFLYLNRKGNDKIYQTPKIRLIIKLEKSQRARPENRFTDSHCRTSYKQLSRNKRENERRSEFDLTRTTCHRVRSVFPVRLSKSPLCSPLFLGQNGFRFISIGVSVEILRREQNHSPGHLARGREQPSPRSPRPWPPRLWKPHFSLL
ncbi:hypothetical protein Bca101_067420 [Brassica carinata]